MKKSHSPKPICLAAISGLILMSLSTGNLQAIVSYPTALDVSNGISQDWGSSSFSSMPSGFIAATELDHTSSTIQGASTTVLNTNLNPTAETSTSSMGSTQAPGPYGYATGGDAIFVISPQNSSSLGTNALLMAIDTTGLIDDITLSYDLEAVVASSSRRGAGIVTQYRIGQTGGWTTLNDSYFFLKSAPPSVGTIDHFTIVLPPETLDESEVQIRWVGYHEPVIGLFSAIGIDDIVISVPEPSTYALFLGAFTASIVFLRKKKGFTCSHRRVLGPHRIKSERCRSA